MEGVSEHALREGEENLPHLLLFADLGELAGQCWRDLLGNEEGQLAGWPTQNQNKKTNKNQKSETAHPNLHSIYELLEHMKVPFLQI